MNHNNRIRRLSQPSQEAFETVTRYYLQQVPPTVPHEQLRDALSEVREALSCTALAGELPLDDQEQILELFDDLVTDPDTDTAHELPGSSTERVSDVLRSVSLELAFWRLSSGQTIDTGEQLPDVETLRRGADVVVWSESHPDHAFQGRQGTFLNYTDPRIGHVQRQARLHLAGDPENTAVLVRPEYLVLEQPDELDLSGYELLNTWSRHGFTLHLYDTHQVDRYGKSILAFELLDDQHGPEPMFRGADFHCSPMHAIDSNTTAASLLSFLSLRLGDTDREYFDSYSPRQLEWCQTRADDLALLAEELTQPYQPVEHSIDHESWEEADAAGRHNRALVITCRDRGGEERRLTLNSGESDQIHVLTDGEALYALSVNEGVGYVGLQTWVDGDPAGDVFIQSNVEQDLGQDFWDLGTVEMLQRLEPHLGP